MDYMDNDKANFRKLWLTREAELTKDYLAKSDAGIIRNLFGLSEFQSAKTVLFFYSVRDEPDTHEMIRRAIELGKTVALPKTHPGGVMEARKFEGFDKLTPSKFGIPEPAESAPIIKSDEIDFIVVPAVVFDREGYRLGRGMGYYDAYLSSARAFTCGITRERMLAPRVPREKHDVQVNCIVTENEVFRI